MLLRVLWRKLHHRFGRQLLLRPGFTRESGSSILCSACDLSFGVCEPELFSYLHRIGGLYIPVVETGNNL